MLYIFSCTHPVLRLTALFAIVNGGVVNGWEGGSGVDDDDDDYVVVAGIEGRGPWEGVSRRPYQSERKATYTGVGTLTRPVLFDDRLVRCRRTPIIFFHF